MSSAWQWSCTTSNDATGPASLCCSPQEGFPLLWISDARVVIPKCGSAAPLPWQSSPHCLNSSQHGDSLCYMQCAAVFAMLCLPFWGKYLDPKAMPSPLVLGAVGRSCPKQQAAHPHQGGGQRGKTLHSETPCRITGHGHSSKAKSVAW